MTDPTPRTEAGRRVDMLDVVALIEAARGLLDWWDSDEGRVDRLRHAVDPVIKAVADLTKYEAEAASLPAPDGALRAAATDVVLQEGHYYRLGSKTPDRLLAVVPQAALRKLEAALATPDVPRSEDDER